MDFDWLIGKRCTAVTATGHNPEGAVIFAFEDAEFRVETLWRISRSGRLFRTRDDHGQRYGLDHPIDARADAAAVLVDRAIVSATVDTLRGDVAMVLEEDTVLEFLTDASYEAWELTARGRHLVAAAGGEVMRVVQVSPSHYRHEPIHREV